ncbi:helix-turn-helix domain-containing protein [Methylobacterium sp. E-066]|uniref:helix-turn-helix domain-containing protein n=1 Tax=Methylobacterium sp. E-066 TaxID=2836584 RepID=UPI001FB8DCE8|nr:helix-turn-helix domain-containing protein [Methylobacterium sp. E-066]MCJ2143444.1 helix-turn-helix domain-containing protein [Methylobacterium sp. E-066]
MRTLFSTAALHPREAFDRWREALIEQGMPVEQHRLDETPFKAKLTVARVGPLVMTSLAQAAMRTEATPSLIRRCADQDRVDVLIKIAGVSRRIQEGQESVQRPGDLVVYDRRPSARISCADSQTLVLTLPRKRLEDVLGPTRLYASLTIGADLASTRLATSFITNLIRLRDQIPLDVATRMVGIGTDLIMASIAERLAKDVPRPLHGTVVVQRAKAHVEANLGDPALDPPQLAAATGVSLRRLQELFHARGQHISEYIWHRRLEAAGKRLTDPGCAHLPVGILAFNCGFSSQAHFSKRFKAHFGLPPREYRHAALMKVPCASPDLGLARHKAIGAPPRQ